MNTDYLFVIFCVISGIVIAGVVVFLVWWGASSSCYASWGDKFKPSFNFLAGCTIEVSGDRIPSKNYRVL